MFLGPFVSILWEDLVMFSCKALNGCPAQVLEIYRRHVMSGGMDATVTSLRFMWWAQWSIASPNMKCTQNEAWFSIGPVYCGWAHFWYIYIYLFIYMCIIYIYIYIIYIIYIYIYIWLPASSKSCQISAPTSRTDPGLAGLLFHPKVWFVFFAQISWMIMKNMQRNKLFRYGVIHARKWVIHTKNWVIYIYILYSKKRKWVINARKCFVHIPGNELFIYKERKYSYTKKWAIHTRKWVIHMNYSYKEMSCSYKEMSYS